jgi:hypothetical protein
LTEQVHRVEHNMATTIMLDGKERNAAWTGLSILSNIETHLRDCMPPRAAPRLYPVEWAAIRDIARAQRLLSPELFPYSVVPKAKLTWQV